MTKNRLGRSDREILLTSVMIGVLFIGFGFGLLTGANIKPKQKGINATGVYTFINSDNNIIYGADDWRSENE